MTSTRQRLELADPLRHEVHDLSRQRDLIRRRVLAEVVRVGDRRVFSRKAFAASTAAAVGAIALGGGQLASRLFTPVQAAVRFEVRLAEQEPSPGLFQARVRGSDDIVYLHNEVVVANGDIALSRSEPSGTGYVVHVSFTPTGAEKMRQATSTHIGKPIAILMDGEVIMAPRITSPVTDDAVISGGFDGVEADRIADGIAMP